MDAVDRLWRNKNSLSGVSVGFSFLLKRILKVNVDNPSTPDIEEVIMLAGVIAGGNMTFDYLYEIGLPKNPFKK
jgi:hypothetical protein